jgi:hypothetical protein
MSQSSNNEVGNGVEHEMRGSARHALAVPIRVRPERVPWFEEAMTVDISPGGLSFLSNREYEPGEELLIAFGPSTTLPWNKATEFRAQVVRVLATAPTPALTIAVSRLPHR